MDMTGPMNKRIQKFLERTETYSPALDGGRPPFAITAGVVSRWGPGDAFRREKRDTLSLSLVTCGSARFEQEGRRGEVLRGQVFLAHKGSSQRFETGDAGYLHKRSLILEGPLLSELVASLRLGDIDVATPRDEPGMARLFREAYRLLRTKADTRSLELPSLALRILLVLAESRAPDYPLPLRLAMRHLDAHLHRPMTVAEIARVAGLSVRHCARLFRKHLNCSPLEFCLRQRMALAQSLLANTNQPVKQIAAEVGYDDQLYFSAQFRRRLGMSPSVFRQRRMRGDAQPS
jgi:AraC-like DNA-binding protein